MPRLVRHDATGPLEIKPQAESVWICMCGLSQNLPHCDGSHNKSKSEEAGKLCVYDKARSKVIQTQVDA